MLNGTPIVLALLTTNVALVAMAFTLDDAVRAAREDAARRGSAAPASFELIDSAAVTWSDGSLGCPQPGRYYTQALVPGWRLRLKGPAGTVLDYHASTRGAVVFCEPGRAIEPAPDPRI